MFREAPEGYSRIRSFQRRIAPSLDPSGEKAIQVALASGANPISLGSPPRSGAAHSFPSRRNATVLPSGWSAADEAFSIASSGAPPEAPTDHKLPWEM